MNGERRLRLDNEVGNAHNGVMAVVAADGDPSDCNGDGQVTEGEKPAFQRVYTDTANDGVFNRATDTTYTDVAAGCVAHHVEHNHTHYDDFASYELKRLSDGVVVSAASKVTFCIADVRRFRYSLVGSPGSGFYTSCTGLTQGLSVGWSDEYPYYVSGQHLVVNPGGQYVGDGYYCLVSTADPTSKLAEDNNAGDAELNNAASVKIRLRYGGSYVTTYRRSSCGGVGPEPW